MKTKINFLLENGLSKKTISNLTESQINALVEKFKKSEEKEAFQKVTIPSQTQLKGTLTDLAQTGVDVKDGNVKYDQGTGMVTVTTKEGEIAEDATIDDMLNKNEFGGNKPVNYDNPQDYGTNNSTDPNGSLDGIPQTEGEIKEKFESKAQQGLFWARCNKCSSKNCKWCKMAKEFSDSTSKKQYKDMPEKKHPEKTVEYKKKETKESLQNFIENTIVEMLENEVDAKMSKKDLIDAIKETKKKDESFILRKPKKVTMFSDEAPMELPIGKIFSIGKSKK